MPAFPCGDMTNKEPFSGMTLREHFAGLIMQAEKIHHGASGKYSFNPKDAARSAVECADALITELGKGGAS
jgi:hypothetical protein